MKPANFAPVYACLYPELAEIARKHGYALAVHGSLARDFDLVCVPWVDDPDTPEEVIDEIVRTFAIRKIGELTPMKHGRMCQTISLKFGEAALDLSFMPVVMGGDYNTDRESLRAAVKQVIDIFDGAYIEIPTSAMADELLEDILKAVKPFLGGTGPGTDGYRLASIIARLDGHFPDRRRNSSELPEAALLREVEQYVASYRNTLAAIHGQKCHVPEIENLNGESAIRKLVQLLVDERERTIPSVPTMHLPTREVCYSRDIQDACYANGWNACLDAIKTLNIHIPADHCNPDESGA